MSNPIINVNPVEIIKKIEKVEIIEVKVIPFTRATIRVMLRDINDIYIDNRDLEMTSEEYLEWLNDDTYLINLILQKLNMIKI